MEAISSVPIDAKLKLEFGYDYMGKRVNKKVYTWNPVTSTYSLSSERRFFYDGWNLIAETDGANVLTRFFMWGLDLSGTMEGAGGVGGLLSIKSISPAITAFVSYDGNGNVTQLTSASDGTTLANYKYGPFGELIRKPFKGTTYEKITPFFFSTKFWDEESDLLYYGYRYYNSTTGSWLSRDPMEEEGGLSLYGFVGNDAVGRWDLPGLSSTVASEGDVTAGPLAMNDAYDLKLKKTRTVLVY